jgi:hypothetical protein
MKKDQLYFILAVVGAFLLLLAGAWTSPTFAEQRSYVEALVMFGALLFVFSAVVVVAALGFHSFALFMALFLAMAVSLYGVEAGVMVIVMTYLVWGLVFAIEMLLYHNGVESAVRWFRERYTFKAFSREYKAFYPMIWGFWFLFEYIPHRVTGESIASFNPRELRERMRQELRP